MQTIKFKKLRENAVIPQRATPGSAGVDLCACIDEGLLLRRGEHALVPTGLAIMLEDSSQAAMIFARSGLAVKHGIGLINGVGVVDSDYRGEICVGLINQTDKPYLIMPGERIAQLVVMPVCNLPTQEVEQLDETLRGSGGFGSTGV